MGLDDDYRLIPDGEMVSYTSTYEVNKCKHETGWFHYIYETRLKALLGVKTKVLFCCDCGMIISPDKKG